VTGPAQSGSELGSVLKSSCNKQRATVLPALSYVHAHADSQTEAPELRRSHSI
jgi:hypothetical protein